MLRRVPELRNHRASLTRNDVPSGIAGIMGGASSEISETTKDVLVEMAWFEPMPIAKSSRRLGVRSEASARRTS